MYSVAKSHKIKMVICKFFLQGNCRFGSNCRFEHSYNSKYSYHAPQGGSQQTQQSSGSVTDEQLVNQVRGDVNSVLHGRQWVLSCYAPFKEKPNLPGLSDVSPEEARFLIYDAKANNVYEQAAAHMKNLEREMRQKYEQLLQPIPAITLTLRQLYNGESVNSPFTTQTAFGSNAASSVFRSAVQSSPPFGGAATTFGSGSTNAQSIFAQASQSVFGSPQQQAPSPFGLQSPDTAKSLFAQANQSQSPQSVFQTSADPARSIFASATQQFFTGQPGTPFGQQQSAFTQQKPADPFNQQKPADPFNQQKPSDRFAQSVFQRLDQPSNVFGTANVFAQQNPDDDGIYSKMEELSESDLEAFNSVEFKLGFIPEIPPPQSLCV